MATSALNDLPGRNTPVPQSQRAREDQVLNDAGGFVFQVDDFTRLRRFLILGTEGGTFYVNQKVLTLDNFGVLKRCLAADYRRTVNTIVDVSVRGRAPKNDQAIFALAFAASDANPEARAYALSKLKDVCRIGTHLFMFAEFVEKYRGWGRGLRTAVGDWYVSRDPESLQVQLAKYQSRGGWSHADMLRLAKPRPLRTGQTDRALGWSAERAKDAAKRKEIDLVGLDVLQDFERLQRATTPVEAVGLLEANHALSWEMIPSELLKSPDVWASLVPHMGLTALIRNLGRLTSIGLLGAPFKGPDECMVAERLTNAPALAKARVHPFQMLLALDTYGRGQGDKGSLTWSPSGTIIAALEEGFEAAFGGVQSANKRTLVALDVSGSMEGGRVLGTGISVRKAAAAMALVTARTEPQVEVCAFTASFQRYPFQRDQGLSAFMNHQPRWDNTRTDCAQPMLWAAANNVDVETIVIYTDNETWAGGVLHPYRALEQLRQKLGHDVRLAVVAMTSPGFSIADPKDPSSLDVVGFDTNTPALLSEFSAGLL